MDFLQPLHSLTGNVLFEIGLIILIATILAYLARLSKQPLIPAYILAGLLIGPIGLGLIKDISLIKALSEMGIAFLLFVIGLEINVKKLKQVGIVSIIAGLIQVLLVFIAGFFVASYLGFEQITSIYIGLILTFSSTMLVVKLLSDEENIDTLHGRIILSILLIQDLLIIIALTLLNITKESFSLDLIGFALLKTLLIVAGTFLITKYLSLVILKYAAKSKELLFLVSISFLFLFAMIAYLFEFSIAIGAFVAGIGLASTHYSVAIKSRVEPIKDFFATIFFVSLGMQLVLTNIDKLFEPLIIFLLISLLLKPIILFFIIVLSGYQNKVSFLTGLSLGQTSEFSLILAIEGLALGMISQEIFSLAIILAVSTMVITSYTIKHSTGIYLLFSGILKPFDKLALIKRKLEYTKKGAKTKIALFGCHRMGGLFLETFRKSDKKLIVIDHNPTIIEKLNQEKVSCIYGDISSREILDKLDFKNLEIVISTVPNDEENMFLIEYIKSINPNIIMIVTADHLGQAFDLYDYGADYVIIPHLLSGEAISGILKRIMKSKKEISKIKQLHLKYLEGLNLSD